MPVHSALCNRTIGPPPVLLLTVSLLWGCASNGSLPAQYGLSFAVWLEDQCQSSEADEQSITLLEALHDGLIVPSQMLVAVAAVTVIGSAWSFYDRVTIPSGTSLPNRPEMVLAYFMPQRAGPAVHNRRHIDGMPVTWFACLAYDDG